MLMKKLQVNNFKESMKGNDSCPKETKNWPSLNPLISGNVDMGDNAYFNMYLDSEKMDIVDRNTPKNNVWGNSIKKHT